MFKPLATTMCFATAGSLLVALTVVPALSSRFLRARRTSHENLAVRALKRVYLPILSLTLRARAVTVLAAIGLFVAAVALIPHLGTEFLPPLDEGAIAINVVRLPSAALEGSVAVAGHIERRLAKFPEVSAVVTKTGRAEISEDPMGPEQSDVNIILHPRNTWATGRSREELIDAMAQDLARIPGLRLAFSQPIALRVNELISGIKSDLAIKLFGPDLELLRETANRIGEVLRGIEGARDVSVQTVAGFSQVEIVIDRKAIARRKINVADINDIIETAVGGKTASTIMEGSMRFAAVVRFPERYRDDIEALKRLLIPAPEGPLVPLGDLAEIRTVEAPFQISRENTMRRIVVECNTRGRDMGGFVNEARRKLEPVTSALPAGYFLKFGGQFENQQRAMLRLAVVVPISILLIFLMLFMALGSIRSALLVLTNIPFALVGGVLAIYALDINLSVSACIGFIALFGMAVVDGTVLVSFFDQLRREGLSTHDAILQGCRLRFTPILMVTLTTLLGLLPLFYATGSGSEIQRPLATVVMGGLVSDVLLVFIVLPALYSLVESRRGSASERN